MRIKQGTFLDWWAKNILDYPQDVCSFVKQTVILPFILIAFAFMLFILTAPYWAGVFCLYTSILYGSAFLAFTALLGFGIQLAILRDWLREDTSQAQWMYDILTYNLFGVFKKSYYETTEDKGDGIFTMIKYWFKGVKDKMCVRIEYVK